MKDNEIGIKPCLILEMIEGYCYNKDYDSALHSRYASAINELNYYQVRTAQAEELLKKDLPLTKKDLRFILNALDTKLQTLLIDHRVYSRLLKLPEHKDNKIMKISLSRNSGEIAYIQNLIKKIRDAKAGDSHE